MDNNLTYLDYIDYPDTVTRYDMSNMPQRQNKTYAMLAYLLSSVALKCIRGGYKIEKINTDGLKPPYLLLCNHMQFMDFCVSFKAAHPHEIYNIATIDGFAGRKKIMEKLGCICTRKFTVDINLVRACRKVLQEYGQVLCMYPEARYSPIGTTSIIPDVVGKLAKKNKVPVVILLNHGNYLNSPFWDFHHYRKVPFYATFKQILTAEQVSEMSVEEINEIIRREMEYDEYRWQKENNIRITEKNRALGLNKVLYQCPNCKTEGKMTGEGIHLCCEECGKKWELTELGEMKATVGETEFSHIPDWFEWQRANVRRQLLDGTYKFEDEVTVYTLPDAEYLPAGKGKLTHDLQNGFVLTGNCNGQDYKIQRTSKSIFALHTEYDFNKLDRQDLIDISTNNDSFYCIPTQKDVVTKLGLATEEAYKIATSK